VAFFISLGASPLSIWFAGKIGAIDMPKDRGMHGSPMPRLGGLAIFIGSMVAMLICMPIFPGKTIDLAGIYVYSDDRLPGVLIGGFLIFTVGLIDDIKNLPPKVKLIGQILAAIILFLYSIRFDGIGNPFVEDALQIIHFPWPVSLLITVIWVVGITNAVNLIDGLDGLAGGVSFISAMCIAYTAYIHGWYLICIGLLALAGGAAGFLPFNFHPAKTFMGDCGALYLGFMLSAFSIMNPVKTTTLLVVAVPMLVLALPILDTAFAIIRRMINRRPIMEADKGHLHHRVMNVGMGQRRTVLILYCISGVMGVSGILISRALIIDALIPAAIGIVLIYVFLTGDNSNDDGNMPGKEEDIR
jgi:UDP-GlcNAc:undecaprenyl-phosphate GlcNAc-1-phosphate transferase